MISSQDVGQRSLIKIWALKWDYANKHITSEKVNLWEIKHNLTRLNTLRGFDTTAVVALVWPVTYGG